MDRKLKFRVFDQNGKDVTDDLNWVIDTEGDLYFETDDIDVPLADADGYTYQVSLV